MERKGAGYWDAKVVVMEVKLGNVDDGRGGRGGLRAAW